MRCLHLDEDDDEGSTECARDRDLNNLVSCGKFVNDILFSYIVYIVYIVIRHTILLWASCPSCDFELVP